MARPTSHHEAARIARQLLAHAQPGRRAGTVRRRMALGARIATLLWQRWQVGPWQWRLKHLAWYLDVATRNLAPSTRYDHWRCLRALLHATGREDLAQRLAARAGPASSFLRPAAAPGRLRRIGRPPRLPQRTRARRA